MKRVVDADNADTGIRPSPNTKLSRVAIAVTAEDQHLVVPAPRQRGGEIANVDFGAAVCVRWKPVDDLQNAHQIPLVRRSSRPARTDRAPRYWPSGCATPNAAPRSTARMGWPGSCAAIRALAGMVVAMARNSDPRVGTVARPKIASRR